MKVVVDRIEGDKAVLVDYEDDNVTFILPVSRLPDGTRGGDHLSVTFVKDIESRAAENKRAEDLLEELRALQGDN